MGCLCVIACALLQNQPAPTVDRILDNYIRAAGGESALAAVTTRAGRGTFREGAQAFPIETSAKYPNRWVLVIRTPPPTIYKYGLSGATAWQQASEMVQEMSAAYRAEFDSILNPRFPLELRKQRASLGAPRLETRGGRGVYVVRAPAGTLVFDASTGLLAEAFGASFADYRMVGGIMVPFRVGIHNGHATLYFASFEHGAAMDDARFGKPAESPGLRRAFDGLDDARVVPVLRRTMGQGVTAADGRILHDLIVNNGYRRALDIGTARGYAALWFAMAMKKTGGKVVTIEIDPRTAAEARENFREAGLDAVVESRVNDALRDIPAIPGEFDFVFMDTGAPLNKRLLDLVYARVRPGGAIVAHNASELKEEQPDYVRAIAKDPNLATRVVETASGGISISIKRR